MTKIILVRHGQTLWNNIGKYQGHTDIPLNNEGIQQVTKVAKGLKEEKIDAVYSSDLLRARQTAEAIAQVQNLQVNLDPSFREINFGVWEGKTYQEVEVEYPDLLQIWRNNPENLQIPQGETFSQLIARVWQGLNTILDKHTNETVVLVAHGGTIGAIICTILGIKLNNLWRIKQDNTGISIINFYDDKGIISLINDTNHLKIS